MTPLLISIAAGIGTYLIFTSVAFRRRDLFGQNLVDARNNQLGKFDDWLTQAGIPKSVRKNALCKLAGFFALGAVFGWLLFGGILTVVVMGVFTATFPIASLRQRRIKLRSDATEAWPKMIEEIRLLCGSAGKPIPQALLEVGKRAPGDMKVAFSEAEREWLISTDFSRTVAVLRERLSDPTADVVCETLLIAHTVGGSGVDRRLAALASERQQDLQSRREAVAKQSGVRFARRFVLLVPFGMALTGMSIGSGRVAFQTTQGQLGVLLALATLGACWWWAGRLIRLPEEQRVFRSDV